jgi:predicted O-methyltransferase YrrM
MLKSKNKSFLCPMGKAYTTVRFLAHLWRAKRWDAFHSPYLFDLFTTCCDEGRQSPAFQKIEQRRSALLSSNMQIPRMDYGAGSLAGHKQKTAEISGVAANALSRPFQCRFLFRLVGHLQPHRILEFGTSLGITAAYMAAGWPESGIDTVEGDPEIAKIAEDTFAGLGYKTISQYPILFGEYINTQLHQKETIDLLFLDGHHTSAALLHYYDALKPKLHKNTVIIVDDIYWSGDMTSGWNTLIQYPEVTQSVDCFHFGLIFFRDDFIGRENHRIRLPLKMMLT